MPKSPRTFTWLHLSDLHARTKGGWDSTKVISTLVEDLKLVSRENQLIPDCIFFTGDAAYGGIDGETMPDQYQRVKEFFEAVRKAFSPEIPTRRIYLVPGNHDVDRAEVTPDQTSWLRDWSRTLADITTPMQKANRQWQLWLERLSAYRNFISSYKLTHLGLEDPHLIWGDCIEIDGTRIGIAGFNTAWSCIGDDKAKLWFGGDFQSSQLRDRIGPVDFTVALLHHPANWFTDKEDPQLIRQLRNEFPVILHGHEHQHWVDVNDEGRIIVSAGACYESSWMANGYSFGRIDIDESNAQIWLRQWDKAGGGWVARDVAGKTKHGIWPVKSMGWLRIKSSVAKTEGPQITNVAPNNQVTQHYTVKFCENVCTQHDVLELFGCDIPRELQRHKLSVAYVSLNLGSEPNDSPDLEGRRNSKSATTKISPMQDVVEEAGFSTSVEQALDKTCEGSGRLMILGPAGAGKTTLLRWCAIEAARGIIDGNESLHRVAAGDVLSEEWKAFVGHNPPEMSGSWRWKIPVLIRLRDCPEGKLPATPDLPKFLAKHLPTAPCDWMTNVFQNGRALILLDGVDEVNRDRRSALAVEIELLINTYPDCTYVVTTRPGAVENGWLAQLNFVEARVEPMSRQDRAEFIDKWFRSASLAIKRLRAGEDLGQTAQNLKAELEDRPDLGILATNPLLCAMICALYRERQDQLPESPAELSEALCQMLLHRRERETPVLSTGEHYPHGWRELQYEQKKGLLAKVAWEMMTGIEPSSIAVTKAVDVVGRVLSTTPGHASAEAGDIMNALIERSGLLRLASDERIEFLHNTLKEYLAAGNAVEIGNPNLLVKRADDPAWQPVILFALALAPEPFSSAIVRSLLSSSSIGRSTRGLSSGKVQRQAVAQGKAKDFFLVRCRRSAKWLAANLCKRIDKIAAGLFPPSNMDEVEALAQLGPRLLVQAGSQLLDPSWWSQQTMVPEPLRGLRLLRLIGGPRAQAAFASIQKLPSYSTQLYSEWVAAASELHPQTTLKWPFRLESSIRISNRSVTDLGPLRSLSKLNSLFVDGTGITSLNGIQHLKGLRRISANWCTNLRNFDALHSFDSPVSLNVNGAAIIDLEPLDGAQIDELEVGGGTLETLAGVEKLTALRSLSIGRCRHLSLNRILSWLATGPQLRSLHLYSCRIGEPEFTWTRSRLGILVKLQELILRNVDGPSEPLKTLAEGLSGLKSLTFNHRGAMYDLVLLAPFLRPNIETLNLSFNDRLCDIGALAKAKLDNLKTLDLSYCRRISDFSSLTRAHLPKLQTFTAHGYRGKALKSLKDAVKNLPPKCTVDLAPYPRRGGGIG